MYQIPYACMVPVLNDDVPTTFQEALAYKGARHGIFNRPFSLTTRPNVELTSGVFEPSPAIGTQVTSTVHHGIYLAIQRGGTGYVSDIIVEVSATIRFYNFDGKDT